MSALPESFEQDEPFTVRLRGILMEYPPGVSILKEMLQNADDAGAKLIVWSILRILLIYRLIRLIRLRILQNTLWIPGWRNIKVLHSWVDNDAVFSRRFHFS